MNMKYWKQDRRYPPWKIMCQEARTMTANEGNLHMDKSSQTPKPAAVFRLKLGTLQNSDVCKVVINCINCPQDLCRNTAYTVCQARSASPSRRALAIVGGPSREQVLLSALTVGAIPIFVAHIGHFSSLVSAGHAAYRQPPSWAAQGCCGYGVTFW